MCELIVASTYWYVSLTFMESLCKVGDNILMVIQELSDNTIVSLLQFKCFHLKVRLHRHFR